MVKLSEKEVTSISTQKLRLSLPQFGAQPSSSVSHAALKRTSIITTIVFAFGLALTAAGVVILRSEQRFTWVPKFISEPIRPYIPYNEAVIVGSTLALAGAVIAGLAGRRLLPDSISGSALPVP